MKNNNYNVLKNLIELEERTLIQHQETISTWTNSIDNKELTSEEANNIYSPICEQYHNMHDILYKQYYELVHSLITNEVVDEIQKKIDYDFMSIKFINELINYI